MRLFMHARHGLLLAALGVFLLIGVPAAFGQATLLSGWENANELSSNFPTGTGCPGAGPCIANGAIALNGLGQGTTPLNGMTNSPSGRWYAKDQNGTGNPAINLGNDILLSHSTTVGVVNNDPDFPGSTGAFKLTQGGSNRGGGTSHYNFSAAGIYLYDNIGTEDFPTRRLVDPLGRGQALINARDASLAAGSAPSGWQFEFDVTWDVENLVHRDPNTGTITNFQTQFPAVSVGLYMAGGVNPGGNNWIVNDVLNPGGDGGVNILSGNQTFAMETIDTSDAPGSMPVDPVTRHVVVRFPTAAWPTLMENGNGSLFNPGTLTLSQSAGGPQMAFPATSLAVGFILNGNWNLGPVTNSETSASVYFDNLKLVFVDPIATERGLIDFNNDNMATVADWNIFLANYLADPATYPIGESAPDDLTCGTCWWDKGDVDHDGDNDFQDYNLFVEKYNFVNFSGGGGGLSPFERMIAGVPEPGSALLMAMGIVGAAFTRRRYDFSRLSAWLLVGVSLAAAPSAANAQLLESWESPGNLNGWTLNIAGDMISVNGSHSSHGTQSLALTRTPQLDGNGNDIGAVSWDNTTPQFQILADAINLGPQHYEIQVDVIYDAAQLSASAVTSVIPQLYLGTNTGNNRVVFDTDVEDTYTPGDGFPVSPMSRTLSVPLNSLAPSGTHIGDVEADGTTLYQMQIGFGGTQDPNDPQPSTTIYFDNLRLVQVTQPQFLTLNVNRSNGLVTITNTSDTPIDMSYYEIRSAAGGLVPGNWTSIDDGESDGPGLGWDEAGAAGATNNVLAELKLLSPTNPETTVPNDGTPISLGFIYNTAMDTQDLVFQYRNLERPNKLIGGGPSLVNPIGDYNDNGIVDAADYTVWRDALNQDIVLPNEDETQTPGSVTSADYTVWKNNYGETGTLGPNPADYLVVYSPPVGGGGGIAGPGVPEPTAFVMAIATMSLVVTGGFTRRRF